VKPACKTTSNKSINKTPVVGLRDGKTANQQDSSVLAYKPPSYPSSRNIKRFSRQDNQQDSRKLSDRQKKPSIEKKVGLWLKN
jgi:hypothetical protein